MNNSMLYNNKYIRAQARIRFITMNQHTLKCVQLLLFGRRIILLFSPAQGTDGLPLPVRPRRVLGTHQPCTADTPAAGLCWQASCSVLCFLVNVWFVPLILTSQLAMKTQGSAWWWWWQRTDNRKDILMRFLITGTQYLTATGLM